MGKKWAGGNSKALDARARKAATKKQNADSKKKAAEDAKW